MVTVSFVNQDGELLRLSVTYGESVLMVGDSTWIDFLFAAPSRRLGRPVTFTDDAEEWARCLPEVYAGPELYAQVLEDTAMEVVSAAEGAALTPQARRNFQQLRGRPRLIALVALLVVLLVVLVLTQL